MHSRHRSWSSFSVHNRAVNASTKRVYPGGPLSPRQPMRLLATDNCCCQVTQMCNVLTFTRRHYTADLPSMQRQLSSGRATPFESHDHSPGSPEAQWRTRMKRHSCLSRSEWPKFCQQVVPAVHPTTQTSGRFLQRQKILKAHVIGQLS